MCSQLAADFLEIFGDVNSTPQYTHLLSLSLTSFSSQVGMFQLFVIGLSDASARNVGTSAFVMRYSS